MRWLRSGLVGAGLVIGLLGSLGPANAANRQVYIDPNGSSGKFVASSGGGSGATISQNDTVYWLNRDDQTHNVTGDDGTWAVGDIGAGAEKSHTFTEPGRFTYHCAIHPAMTGEFQVNPSSQPPPQPAPPPPPPAPISTAATRPLTSTTRGATGSTVSTTATTVGDGTTTTAGFGVLAPTTTLETTSTTGVPLAINETSSGGTSPLAIVAIAFGSMIVLGGVGYLAYKLRSEQAA